MTYLESAKQISNATGFSVREVLLALSKVDYDLEAAKIYLMIRGDAVARYKIVNNKKILWTEQDYIEAALQKKDF